VKSKATGQIRLTLASRPENAALAGLAVRGICSGRSWTAVEVYQIELCVVEAVQNAICHAYGGDGGREVEVTIAEGPGRIEFRVSDTGKPMAAWPEETCLEFDPQDVRRLPERGRGLCLIRTIMDEVRYGSRGGCNTLTMVRRMPA